MLRLEMLKVLYPCYHSANPLLKTLEEKKKISCLQYLIVNLDVKSN